MTQIQPELAIGVAVFLGALILLWFRTQSLFLGFSIHCLFAVTSASLAGIAHSLMFGLETRWLTDSHIRVIQLGVAGGLAILFGIGLAWRLNKTAQSPKRRAPLGEAKWINDTFAWVVFMIGAIAMVLKHVLFGVPTIGTAITAVTGLTTLGLLVGLVESLRSRRGRNLLVMLAIYVPLALIEAFSSGHTPAKVSLLIPAICVIAAYRRVGLGSLLLIIASGFAFLAIMSGWMETRQIIRSGQLTGLSSFEKARIFLPAWFDATCESGLDPRRANHVILERIDMTKILAMQVRHQPRFQPYVYGQTVLDAAVALVPRVLWPGKPVIAGGTGFVEKFTGMVRAPGDNTSIGLPYQFELYANGGAICVIVGLFVVGYSCASLERSLFQPDRPLPALLSRVFITMTLCDGGQRADVVVPTLVAGAVTYYAIGLAIERLSPNLCSNMLGNDPVT